MLYPYYFSLISLLYIPEHQIFLHCHKFSLFFFLIWAMAFETPEKGDYRNISSFISGLNPHFIHPRSWRSSGTCSLHLCGGRRRFWGGNSAVSTLSLCGETRRMRSHTSPRWNRHWQDALFVPCNGVIGGPKELRQSRKRWCVWGVCWGWPLLS